MAVKDSCSCVHRKARTPLDKISLDDEERKVSLDKGSAQAVKQGVLVKQGNRWRKVWNERYVILDHKSLRYYASGAQDGAPRGKIHLGPRTTVCKLDGGKAPRIRGAGLDWKGVQVGHGMPFCFQITTDLNESFLFQALSDNDRNNWIQAIQQCLDGLAVNGVERETAKGKKRKEEFDSLPCKIVLGDDDDIISGGFLSEGLEKQIKSALQKKSDVLNKSDPAAKNKGRSQGKAEEIVDERREPPTTIDDRGLGSVGGLPGKARNFTLCGIRSGCMSKEGGSSSWFPLCDRNPPTTYESSSPQNSSPEAHPDAFPLSPRSAGDRKQDAEATRQYQVGTTDVQRKTKAILSKNVPKPQFTKKSKESKERKADMENSSPILKVLDNHGNRKIAEAIYEFKGEETDEIDLEIGDKVAIIEEFDDGWCQIQLLGPGAKRAKELDAMMKEGKHEEIAGWRKKGIVPRSYLQIINPDMPNEPHAGHENESAQNVSASVLSDSKTEEHVSSSSGAESPKEDRHGDLPPTILRRHDETKEATTPNDSVVKNNPQTNGTKSIVFDVQDEEETSGCCVRCFSFKKPKNVL